MAMMCISGFKGLSHILVLIHSNESTSSASLGSIAFDVQIHWWWLAELFGYRMSVRNLKCGGGVLSISMVLNSRRSCVVGGVCVEYFVVRRLWGGKFGGKPSVAESAGFCIIGSAELSAPLLERETHLYAAFFLIGVSMCRQRRLSLNATLIVSSDGHSSTGGLNRLRAEFTT